MKGFDLFKDRSLFYYIQCCIIGTILVYFPSTVSKVFIILVYNIFFSYWKIKFLESWLRFHYILVDRYLLYLLVHYIPSKFCCQKGLKINVTSSQSSSSCCCSRKSWQRKMSPTMKKLLRKLILAWTEK